MFKIYFQISENMNQGSKLSFFRLVLLMELQTLL